jgi:hypothetical protein
LAVAVLLKPPAKVEVGSENTFLIIPWWLTDSLLLAMSFPAAVPGWFRSWFVCEMILLGEHATTLRLDNRNNIGIIELQSKDFGLDLSHRANVFADFAISNGC